MSIHTSDLRDIANNHGWPVCELAADEIEDLEKAYALLFAENAKLRKLCESRDVVIQLLTDPENQPHQYIGDPEGLKNILSGAET